MLPLARVIPFKGIVLLYFYETDPSTYDLFATSNPVNGVETLVILLLFILTSATGNANLLIGNTPYTESAVKNLVLF